MATSFPSQYRSCEWSVAVLTVLASLAGIGCSGGGSSSSSGDPVVTGPVCPKPAHTRVDLFPPVVVAGSGWGTPVRLGAPINSPCPEDAVEISRDGRTLYFFFLTDLFANLPPQNDFLPGHGTYRAARIGGPGDFAPPVFFDLGKGVSESLDGELSFSPDGSKAYFHSTRSTNTGYLQQPPVDDFLDIYEVDIVNGLPGVARNLGAPVNSIYPDGEAAIHPDNVTLYFSSDRPGGYGETDIWASTWNGFAWSAPVNLGAGINSPSKDYQPAFTADGNTMYFMSDRTLLRWPAIYRSVRAGGVWGTPELVIYNSVGEPSITADGRYLYFVHVLRDAIDASGMFDTDIWYVERSP